MCGIEGLIGYRNITVDACNGLHALNRRGDEWAGFICYYTLEQKMGEPIKDAGLASEVAQKYHVYELEYCAMLGHARYPTSGGTTTEDKIRDAQPLKHPDIDLAVAHNGQVHNLLSHAEEYGTSAFKTGCDAEHLLLELGRQFQERDYNKKRNPESFFQDVVLPSVNEVYNRVHGGYAAVFLTNQGIVAFKDPNGVKPLSYGVKEEGWKQRIHMFASETVAFHFRGDFQATRELYGGQVMFVSFDGEVFSRQLRFEPQTPCGFEPAYIMDASSDWMGEKVFRIREQLGHFMAAKWPQYQNKLDRIMAVPHSPIPAAHAMAYDWHIMKGGIIALERGRSFLKSTTDGRRKTARDKFFCEKTSHNGKRIGDIEDSVVRGNTMKELIIMQREVGAAEVHVFSYWPLFSHCCPNGLDVVDEKELLANLCDRDEGKMADYLGADSFHALDIEELIQAGLRRPIAQLCVGCVSGTYPNDKGTINQYFDFRINHRKEGGLT